MTQKLSAFGEHLYARFIANEDNLSPSSRVEFRQLVLVLDPAQQVVERLENRLAMILVNNKIKLSEEH